MKKILLIGDYFPALSWDAFMNKSIAEELVENGHQVILLSKSWCVVNEDCFVGNVIELSCNAPFAKRCFIDPLQVKRTGGELINGFLGLACKIIKHEKIDCVLFSEHIEYGILVELIRNRFDIPCYLSWFTFSNASGYLYDDYASSYIRKTLSYFQNIFTWDSYCEALSKIIPSRNLCAALPFSAHEIMNHSCSADAVNVTGFVRSTTEAEVLSTKLENSFDSVRKYFLLAGKKADKIIASFHFQNVDGYYRIEKLSDFSQLSNNRPTLFTDEVFRKMGFIKHYTALKYGYASIIDDENLRRMQTHFDIISKPFVQAHSQIVDIRVKGTLLAELI